MKRNMLIWTAVLLVGIAIIIIYPMVRVEDEGGGMGALPIIPVGYFLALIGAGGLIYAWIKGRSV